MGAGQFPAGWGGMGYDPVQPLSDTVLIATTPRALRFDPITKTFAQNPDGTLPSIDPIDQQVALLLFIDQGTIRGVPSHGNQLRAKLQRVDPKKAQNIVEDEVAFVLSPLIKAKDIELVSATVDLSKRGTAIITVAYFNLRDPNFSANRNNEPTKLTSNLST